MTVDHDIVFIQTLFS